MFLDIRMAKGVAFDFLIHKSKEDCEKGRSHKGFFKVVIEPDNTAYLYYMYVKPKYRHQGYARSVLNDLKKNASVIKTGLSASARDSIDFLKTQGFVAEGDWMVWKKPSNS